MQFICEQKTVSKIYSKEETPFWMRPIGWMSEECSRCTLTMVMAMLLFAVEWNQWNEALEDYERENRNATTTTNDLQQIICLPPLRFLFRLRASRARFSFIFHLNKLPITWLFSFLALLLWLFVVAFAGPLLLADLACPPIECGVCLSVCVSVFVHRCAAFIRAKIRISSIERLNREWSVCRHFVVSEKL